MLPEGDSGKKLAMASQRNFGLAESLLKGTFAQMQPIDSGAWSHGRETFRHCSFDDVAERIPHNLIASVYDCGSSSKAVPIERVHCQTKHTQQQFVSKAPQSYPHNVRVFDAGMRVSDEKVDFIDASHCRQ
jgi:hypothetical protein